MADFKEIENAIMNNDPKSVEILMKTASNDSIYQLTRASWICVQDVSCLRVLLDYIPINKDFHAGMSEKSLLMAAARENRFDCALLLLDRGANINLKNKFGKTALMYACKDGREEVFDLLIQKGADIYVTSAKGTAIRYAVEKNSITCLKKLLALGPKVEKDNSGDKEHLSSAKSEKWKECIDCKNCDGETPLMHSCENDYVEMADLLLKHGASINNQDLEGRTSIMYAARHSSFQCFKLLFTQGADLDITDELESTLLSSAVLGDGKVLEFLLEKGSLVCDGVLKPHHKAGLLKAIGEEIYFACNFKTLSVAMKYGIFEWDWIIPATRDPLSLFLAPAVRCALCPGIVQYKDFQMSLLPRSFIIIDVPAIKFLLANRYFFPEDYVLLTSNNVLRAEIQHKCESYTFNKPAAIEELKLLDQLTIQPLSLKTWSFLTVSKAISVAGPPNTRSDRVNALLLPQCLKEILKFQTSITELCSSNWRNITAQEAFDGLNFRKEIKRNGEMNCTVPHCLECGDDWYENRAFTINYGI